MRATSATRILVGLIGLIAVVAAAVGLLRTTPAEPPGATEPDRPVEVTDMPRTAAAPVGEPTRLEVPALGIDEPLSAHGLQPDGAMELPPFGSAGWYREGPRPGQAGGAVVVAHLTGPAGPDVFYELATLRPGDEILVHRTNGVARFVVEAVEDVPKEALPYERIWPETDAALLRLITCSGERDPVTLYPDNTVVYAHLVADEPSQADARNL